MDKSKSQGVEGLTQTLDHSLHALIELIKSKGIYVVILLLMVGAIIMVLNNLYQAPPAQVVIEPAGLSATQYQALNKSLQAQQGGSFFTANLPKIQEAALQLPWIEDISIQRDWNRGIVVTALPRQPVAKFGSERLVDASGQAYIPADSRSLQQPDFVNLQGDTSQSTAIMQMMQQVNSWYMPVGIKVQDVFLSPRMTWLFRFDNGLRIIVDNENTSQKLFSVSQLLKNQLADKQEQIQSLDLRYKNGFAITWKTQNTAPLAMLETQASLSSDADEQEESDTDVEVL